MVLLIPQFTLFIHIAWFGAKVVQSEDWTLAPSDRKCGSVTGRFLCPALFLHRRIRCTQSYWLLYHTKSRACRSRKWNSCEGRREYSSNTLAESDLLCPTQSLSGCFDYASFCAFSSFPHCYQTERVQEEHYPQGEPCVHLMHETQVRRVSHTAVKCPHEPRLCSPLYIWLWHLWKNIW